MDEKTVESEPDGTARSPRRALRRALLAGAGVAVVALVIAVGAFAGGGGDPQTPQAATPSPSATPVPGADPGASPADGSEVPDGADEDPEASGPGSAPAPESTPLVGETLPPSATASGALVDGYPEPIMTPMPSSDVLDSSIATEGDVMQVTLVARTTASPDDVREHYREVWGGSGLEPTGREASDTSFADGSTSLDLAFAPDSGTGTVYVILGVFRSR